MSRWQPGQKEGGLRAFAEVLEPEEAQEPILARPVRAALLEWLTEIWAEEDLKAVGLKPRMRALFDGPPGVGKTTLAHHLAARLGLPLACVRPDRVVDCWLGSSSKNLGQLFDAAKPREQGGEGPVVLFFDEFDSLGQKRNAGGRAVDQERNDIINNLLQRLDAHEGFIIAATNHGNQLDQAVWRRFDIQIALEVPGPEERARILERYLAPFQLRRRELDGLAEAFETATPALMRQFCEGVKRQIVVGPKAGWPMAKEAVIERLLAAVQPHPDLGKPRLWSHGVADAAIRGLSWPLSQEEPEDEATAPRETPPGGEVVAFSRRGA